MSHIDYARGGLCGTFNMTSDLPLLRLARRPEYQENATDASANCDRNDTDDYYSNYTLNVALFYEVYDMLNDENNELTSDDVLTASQHQGGSGTSSPVGIRDQGYTRPQPASDRQSEGTEYPSTASVARDVPMPVEPHTTHDPAVRDGTSVTEDLDGGKKVNRPAVAYHLHIHGMDDFWGADDAHLTYRSDAEMTTFNLMTSFTNQELVIHVDREVRPNLRRQPCEEDPSYSRSSCWRRCFLDFLDCSFDGSSEKPICSPTDMMWFHHLYMEVFSIYPEELFATDIPPCSCPRPCRKHRFSFFIRPGEIESTDDWFYVPVSFRPVQRIVETFVTYSFTDLLADMGGYLGLLLGYSILSIFDDLKTVVRSIFCRWSPKKDVVPADDALSVMESGSLKPCPKSGLSKTARGRLRRCFRIQARNRRTCWGVSLSVPCSTLRNTGKNKKTPLPNNGRLPVFREEPDVPSST